MTNSYRDYKTNFINNLPSGVTYDSTLGRFFFNGKKFYTAQSVIWYRDYILKYDPSLGSFTPLALFSSGEQGAWYEPSPSTCFTDTGGTTAASVGDPVARINDSSGNGNHATQATLASRPILRQTGGGLYYLEFDGTDDGMETAAIDFSATDEMSIFAGLTKNSETTPAIVAELSSSVPINNGSFYLVVNDFAGANDYSSTSRGNEPSNLNQVAVTDDTQPSTAAVTALHDISGDSSIIRLDGVQQDEATREKGTGNFGDYPLYIGARNGASIFFNGDLYSLIVRGATTSGTDLTDTESYVADKTGVTL